MNKKGLIWLVVVIFGIALCGAFYQYQIQGTTSNSLMTEIADINNTASVSKNLTEPNNTTNQTTITIPLEKPPFID